MRLLKYSYETNDFLLSNKKFIYAINHTLNHYKSNSVFTFIPKNGCTSLRASLAIANGLIPALDRINWIHENNRTMNASIGELQRAEYTAVILRCPYERISSAFLDKFGTLTPNAERFFSHLALTNTEINKFTFKHFLRLLATSPDNLFFDTHWMPQSCCLVYENYDEYFNLSDSKYISDTILKKCGFSFLPTHSITKNSIKHLREFQNETSNFDLSHLEIHNLRNAGLTPSHISMYDDETIDLVNRIYRVDLDLFVSKFGSDSLIISKKNVAQR